MPPSTPAVEGRVAAAPSDAGGTEPPEPRHRKLPSRTLRRKTTISTSKSTTTAIGDADSTTEMSPRLRARFEAACRKIEDDGGESFGRAFADNFSVMMLVFIPIVAAIMKVLYLFARRKYVEHLLFFLHVHTLFFLDCACAVVFDFAA